MKKLSIIFLLSFLLLSCAKIYDKPLLVKNNIKINSPDLTKSEIEPLIKQKPNKKILYIFPFHRSVYAIADTWKDRTEKKSNRIDKKIEKKIARANKKNKPAIINYEKYEKKKKRSIKSYFMNVIGEPPTLLDSIQIKNSIKQINLYLKSVGFFNPKITYEVDIYKKSFQKQKRAKVTYNIQPGKRYTLNNVVWDIDDPVMKTILNNKIIKNSPLITGAPYNEDLFDEERDRITNELRNNGYYYFSKSYIVFEADTTIGNHLVDLKLKIKPYLKKDENTQKIIETEHPRYKINNIYIYPDFRFDSPQDIKKDTTIVPYKHRYQKFYQDYYFIHTEPFKINPKAILSKLFIRKDDYFQIKNAIETQNALNSLSNFRYINISFKEPANNPNNLNLLDAHIQLTRSEAQSISTEFETTNSGNNLGVSGSVGYKNINFFRNAEILNIRLKGALEIQQTFTGEQEKTEKLLFVESPFNTVEWGIESQLMVPRFFMPQGYKLFTQRNAPRTSFNFGFFYQRRPDFTRYMNNLNFSWDWRETQKKHHQVTPVFINLVRITPDSLFAMKIEKLSKNLQTSYKDHLIGGMRYTYTFSNQNISKTKTTTFLKFNFESVGFISRLSSIIFAGAKKDETYTIWGIRFAQYIRADADFRRYYKINNNSQLVYRTFAGVGLPYGNSNVLPFDKTFNASGSNDIRAWKFRSLGPGFYSDSLNFDKTGDIALVANLEYRFKVYDYLNSAIFIDAGNVWLLEEHNLPGSSFETKNFYRQIALGGGIGFRFDFSFFVIRFDLGMPIYDPALYYKNNNGWLPLNKSIKRTNLNFGIGYPF